jgi:hypothetical protein
MAGALIKLPRRTEDYPNGSGWCSGLRSSRDLHRDKRLALQPTRWGQIVDYGAVRDNGQSDPASTCLDPTDSPLVQLPGTGVIWKICPM